MAITTTPAVGEGAGVGNVGVMIARSNEVKSF